MSSAGWDGLSEYRVSTNLARRQLNPGQKAFAALEYERLYADATKAQEIERKVSAERDPAGRPSGGRFTKSDEPTVVDLPPAPAGKSREKAAKATGVSGASVQRAKALQANAPYLAAMVQSGELALSWFGSSCSTTTQPAPEPESSPDPNSGA